MNKKNYLILVVVLVINSLTCCKAQNSNIENMETYNFEIMNNAQYNPTGILCNGSKTMIYKMKARGTYLNEYPPAPHFYAIQTHFYPNGKIKSKVKYIGEGLGIGESIYYDEEGKITNRVNEDAKFGKIKAEDLLRFIEKEGWINLQTREGIEDVNILEDGRCDEIPSDFRISERTNKDGISYWLITIPPMPRNDFHETIYHLDKETGEVLYKNTEKINYIK